MQEGETKKFNKIPIFYFHLLLISMFHFRIKQFTFNNT